MIYIGKVARHGREYFEFRTPQAPDGGQGVVRIDIAILNGMARRTRVNKSKRSQCGPIIVRWEQPTGGAQ
jgi:hypothetical protein